MTHSGEDDRQAGMTLPELLVAMVVLVVIMLAASTIFISILQNEGIARANAAAGNEAQVAFKQLEYDLRNAVWATTENDGRVLIVATRSATTADPQNALCVTYFYDETAGELKRHQSGSDTVSSSVFLAPDANAVATIAADWPVSGTDVEAVSGGRVFGTADETVVAPEEVQVRLAFATTKDRSPIEFFKAISLRTQSDLVKTCK